MTYTIYHIPGIKIGVTKDLKRRMRNQGFTYWEILEEHTDIYEVSNREIELQKEYGYPVDSMSYVMTTAQLGGETSGKLKRSMSFELAQEVRSKYTNKGNFNPHNRGLSLNDLAREYNVGKMVIHGIVNNLTYIEA